MFTQSSKFFVHSPVPFFKFLFRPATNEEVEKFLDGELDETNLLTIKEKELKNLYEKFCFLNHYNVESLTDSKVENILLKYGYEIVNDDDNCYAFTKI